jgi:hypothetical protein
MWTVSIHKLVHYVHSIKVSPISLFIPSALISFLILKASVGTCRPGTSTYKLQVKISSRACIYVLPRALWLWTLPTGGGLQHCHVSYGSGLHLPAEGNFGAATFLCLRISSLRWGGLRRCHVFYGSEPHLLAEVGSSAVTCHMAPDPASRSRWAPALPRVL